jgi:hypothetical protein
MKIHNSVSIADHSIQTFDVQAFEAILACNIKDVVADLCLADAEIIMSYATNQLHGNINEIVMSSTELYFKNKTLSYAHGAGISLEWSPPPSVVLDMEFVHGFIRVFFKLVLGQQHVGVQIDEMLLNDTICKDDLDTASFEKVVASARLRPLSARFAPSYCPDTATSH